MHNLTEIKALHTEKEFKESAYKSLENQELSLNQKIKEKLDELRDKFFKIDTLQSQLIVSKSEMET